MKKYLKEMQIKFILLKYLLLLPDWGFIFEWTFGTVAGHQHYNGCPVISINTEIIAPLLQIGVIHDVGSPLATGHPIGYGCGFTVSHFDGCVCGSKGTRIMGGQSDCLLGHSSWKNTFDLSAWMRLKSFVCLRGIITSCIVLLDVGISLEIFGFHPIIVRAIDIECLRGGIPNNGRVVDAFPSTGLLLIE